MEREMSKHASVLVWAFVYGLLSQCLVIPVMSARGLDHQKNYNYTPDPNTGTPPTGSHTTPSPRSGGSSGSAPPTHGSSGGGHVHTPPANCGNPPSGGHFDPTPTPPAGGSGGGGYHDSPSTGGSTPATPSTPTVTIPPTPSTPTIISPPTSPIDPGTPSTPGISIPSPPFDPNSPPYGGTCNYWRTHPGLIWSLVGWTGTSVVGAFGISNLPGIGGNMSLLQALSNTHTDGYGALYREGSASLLNSMVNRRFPFTSNQVRDDFVRALHSNKAAGAQAQLFKLANEGRLNSRACQNLILVSPLTQLADQRYQGNSFVFNGATFLCP